MSTKHNNDGEYMSWEDVPEECPACESGIDVGKYHNIIIGGEPYIHPRCCVHNNLSSCDDSDEDDIDSIIDECIMDVISN